MLSSFQQHWGVEQWLAFLKDKDLPILPGTRGRLKDLREEEQERISPRHLAGIVYQDPFLALKLLRRAEGHRSRRLGQETTTALASVLQTGVDELVRTVEEGTVTDTGLAGLDACALRTVLAAHIARDWTALRTDISPEEVALATLLAEIGELLLWHFAPELPLRALDELHSGRALRTAQAQQQSCGFAFKMLTLGLVQAWELPPLITQLIKGSDNIRANIARLAGDTARHIISHPENPAIPADIVNIHNIVQGASHAALIAALPISPEYREIVLGAVADGSYSKDV